MTASFQGQLLYHADTRMTPFDSPCVKCKEMHGVVPSSEALPTLNQQHYDLRVVLPGKPRGLCVGHVRTLGEADRHLKD